MTSEELPTMTEAIACTAHSASDASGQFGDVFKLTKGERTFAIKRIPVSERDYANIMRERDILTRIKSDQSRCPYIVDYHTCYSDQSSSSSRGSYAYLVFDWVVTKLGAHNPVIENQFYVYQRILQQLAIAIEYLHNYQIAHRDVKPDNILLTSRDLATAQVKLTDFGFARTLRPNAAMTVRIGTPFYSAPEILNSLKDYNTKVDVWSFGVVAYELLTGGKPFPAQKMDELKQMQLDPLPGSQRFPAGFEEICMDFANYCLVYRSGSRPTISDVLRHPFFSSHPQRWSFRNLVTEADVVRDKLQHFLERLKAVGMGDQCDVIRSTAITLFMQLEETCKAVRPQMQEERDVEMTDDIIERLIRSQEEPT